MARHDLIRHTDGVEMPACGDWRVLPSQRLHLWRGRRRRLDLTTTEGQLVLRGPSAPAQIELTAGTGGAEPTVLECRGRSSGADRFDVWRFVGEAMLDGRPCAATIGLRYHGVFARGATPVAWLTLGVRIDDTRRRRRARTVLVAGELNLAAPDHLR